MNISKNCSSAIRREGGVDTTGLESIHSLGRDALAEASHQLNKWVKTLMVSARRKGIYLVDAICGHPLTHDNFL